MPLSCAKLEDLCSLDGIQSWVAVILVLKEVKRGEEEVGEQVGRGSESKRSLKAGKEAKKEEENQDGK